MTTLHAPPTLGGLYELPAGHTGWLSSLLNSQGATRVELFIALNEASAKIAAQHDDDQAIANALSKALGRPVSAGWHNETHPLRSPEAAREACAALITAGYQP